MLILLRVCRNFMYSSDYSMYIRLCTEVQSELMDSRIIPFLRSNKSGDIMNNIRKHISFSAYSNHKQSAISPKCLKLSVQEDDACTGPSVSAYRDGSRPLTAHLAARKGQK